MSLTVRIKKNKGKLKAGLLMFRNNQGKLEVLLAMPGGPRNNNSWEIPKGKVEATEDVFEGAVREFQEETGIRVDADFFDYLGQAPQGKNNNKVHMWSFEGRWSPSDGHESNTFKAEWPPGSGEEKEFQEIEEIRWFGIDEAEEKICPEQLVFLKRFKDKNNSDIVINEEEPYQRALKKAHSKMKMRLVGLGGNKEREKGWTNPSFKRSKSAPPGFGGT